MSHYHGPYHQRVIRQSSDLVWPLRRADGNTWAASKAQVKDELLLTEEK